MLDWTASPYAAAYFAFIGQGEEQTEYRAVYALSAAAVVRKVEALTDKNPTEAKETSVEFVRPITDDNPRLVNQGGLFTRAPDGVALERWVGRNFPSENSYVLMKILVPNRDRKECLRSLNRMNINHLTLFPDLYGASKFCNLDLEIPSY